MFHFYSILVPCALFLITTSPCDGGCSNGSGTCANQISRSSCNRRYRCDWYRSCIFDPCREECRPNFQSCSAISSSSLCLSYSDCNWTPDPPPPSLSEPPPPSPQPTTSPPSAPTTPRPTRTPTIAPTVTPTPWVKREEISKTIRLFGRSISIYNDTVLVAASGEVDGFYEYQRDENGNWSESFVRTGVSVVNLAHYGDTAVIGYPIDAGEVHIFSREGSNGDWSEQSVLENISNLLVSSFRGRFGQGVAIEGSTIVIGEPEGKNSLSVETGAAYIYTKNDVTNEFLLEAKLLPPNGGDGDFFGASVDISGNFAVVGAPGARDKPEDYVGYAVVFERINGEWDQGFLLLPNNDERSQIGFGSSVAIHGSTIFVGARVFERSGAGNSWMQTQTLTPAGPSDHVAITENFILSDQYVHQWSTFDGKWIFQQELELEEYGFISAAAISENTAVIGDDGFSGGVVGFFEYVGEADSAATTNESTTLSPAILAPAETPAPSENTPGPTPIPSEAVTTSTPSNTFPSPTTSPPSGDADSAETTNGSETPTPSTLAPTLLSSSSSPLPTASPPSAAVVNHFASVYSSLMLFVLAYNFW